jgi:hypothetical protein
MRTSTVIAVSFVGWMLTTSGAMAAQAFNLEIQWSEPIATDQSRQLALTTSGLILHAENPSPDGRITALASRITSGVRCSTISTKIDRMMRSL